LRLVKARGRLIFGKRECDAASASATQSASQPQCFPLRCIGAEALKDAPDFWLAEAPEAFDWHVQTGGGPFVQTIVPEQLGFGPPPPVARENAGNAVRTASAATVETIATIGDVRSMAASRRSSDVAGVTPTPQRLVMS